MATMRPRSDWPWLALAALLLSRRRKRHSGGHGHTNPPGTVPRVLSLSQIRELAVATGMADPDTGAAIAMAESHGDTHALGDHGDSVGLWQINIPSCPKAYKNRHMLFNPAFNAEAATSMSNGGTDWHLWSAYKDGRYKAYLPKK